MHTSTPQSPFASFSLPMLKLPGPGLVAPLVGACPVHQKVAGSIPGQDIYLLCGFDCPSGPIWEATDRSSSPPLSLSLKSINISLGEALKIKNCLIISQCPPSKSVSCFHSLLEAKWGYKFRDKLKSQGKTLPAWPGTSQGSVMSNGPNSAL